MHDHVPDFVYSLEKKGGSSLSLSLEIVSVVNHGEGKILVYMCSKSHYDVFLLNVHGIVFMHLLFINL